MKKLSVLLLITMILSVFAGCGDSGSTDAENTDASATDGVPTDETEFVAETLSADELDPRKVVYDYMYKMSQIKWTPSELLDLSSISPQLVYTPGTEYVGMPYVTQVAGTYEMFMDVLEDGKYVGPTTAKSAVGNHCSSSIINSWKQVSNTITAGYTVNMMPNKGKGTVPLVFPPKNSARSRPHYTIPSHNGGAEARTTKSGTMPTSTDAAPDFATSLPIAS